MRNAHQCLTSYIIELAVLVFAQAATYFSFQCWSLSFACFARSSPFVGYSGPFRSDDAEGIETCTPALSSLPSQYSAQGRWKPYSSHAVRLIPYM